MKTTDDVPPEQRPPLTSEDRARMALMPSLNGGAVVHAYVGNVMGDGADPDALIKNLRGTFAEVKDGNLQYLEAMLISQAAALQTIFASLARRAQQQEERREFEGYLGLALKAQAQSRVTITALIDMKNPRQATFVSQANIANGPQQVNNGNMSGVPDTTTPAGNQFPQNKLLVGEVEHGSPQLDTGTTAAATRGDTTVEAVGAVHRAKKPKR